jgi:ADP-ribose pyrophosphatase YjhB (NUDIX family)
MFYNILELLNMKHKKIKMADKKNKRLASIDQRALIINSSGHIFLVRQEDQAWDLPGGHLVQDFGWRESLENLIVDLVGLQVMTTCPVHAADFVDPQDGEYTYMTTILCKVFDDEYEIKDPFEEAGWFKVEQVPNLEFSTYEIKDAIMEYLRKEVKTVNEVVNE